MWQVSKQLKFSLFARGSFRAAHLASFPCLRLLSFQSLASFCEVSLFRAKDGEGRLFISAAHLCGSCELSSPAATTFDLRPGQERESVSVWERLVLSRGHQWHLCSDMWPIAWHKCVHSKYRGLSVVLWRIATLPSSWWRLTPSPCPDSPQGTLSLTLTPGTQTLEASGQWSWVATPSAV